MAVIHSGATSDILTIDLALKAGRVGVWPREVVGRYIVRATTGVIAASLVVDAAIFGIRFSSFSDKRAAYIYRIQAAARIVVAAAAAAQRGLYFERYSSGSSGANMTGGATYVPLRKTLGSPASQMQDIRASTTAALGISGISFEGNKVPFMGWTSLAIGSGVEEWPVVFDANEGGPLVLRAGEGLCVRNLVAMPATMTWMFACNVLWEEY